MPSLPLKMTKQQEMKENTKIYREYFDSLSNTKLKQLAQERGISNHGDYPDLRERMVKYEVDAKSRGDLELFSRTQNKEGKKKGAKRSATPAPKMTGKTSTGKSTTASKPKFEVTFPTVRHILLGFSLIVVSAGVACIAFPGEDSSSTLGFESVSNIRETLSAYF